MADGFEKFYSVYPRKIARLDAEKAWRQMSRQYDPEKIIDGAEKFARLCDAEAKEKQYIPYPASWLRAGRWMDGDLQETIVPQKSECLMRKVATLDELKASLVKQHGGIPANLAIEINRAKSLADVSEFLRNRLVPNLNVIPLRKEG